MNSNVEVSRQSLIDEINHRVEERILEESNAELLIKLIKNADTLSEAISIAALGTTYKRTGFHFDARLDKPSNDIKYFKKNEALSFSYGKGETPNKLIIGDNYDALLNLLIEYKGKIDVIYIDPPYGKDSMGEFANTNYNNAITRDNLLSMLYPRLFLAKELLSDEGVIFCSIDDRNYAYVKCLFDEVFAEKNFLATYLWKKTDTPPSLSNKVRKKYEYILCYGKKVSKAHQFTQGKIDGGDAPLINGGNPYKEVVFPKGSVHFNIDDGVYEHSDDKKIKLVDSVIVKDGVNENDFRAFGNWKWKKETIIDEVNNGTFFIVKSKKFSVRYQRSTNDSVKIPQNNLNSDLGIGTNEEAESELTDILNAKNFDNPKPVSLIKFLLNMVNMDDDITVLDFFAGTGTTGHAVLELNEDGGNRQFILCQLNEITDKTPNGIALDVTTKRLKRVMTGECYDGTKDFKWIENNSALGGSLDVYDICTVANFERAKGKTPFDVIDETLYGKEKFKTLKEKIEWVCENFEITQKGIETDEEWRKRLEDKK